MARNFAFKIFLVAQITLEIAGILLKTSGSVYLDNNTRKNIFPFLYSKYTIHGSNFTDFKI